jgi:hypothetical protein
MKPGYVKKPRPSLELHDGRLASNRCGRYAGRCNKENGIEESKLSVGRLEKLLSPSRRESDSVGARGNGRIERASHGAEGLFRC